MAGEGLGQLISLQFTSSRQLAGGVIALLCTVVSGAFPLLPVSGPFATLSYASFVRWGMEALVSVEYAPWYWGSQHSNGSAGCCRLELQAVEQNAAAECTPVATQPDSKDAAETLVDSYGYNLWWGQGLLDPLGHAGSGPDLSAPADPASPGVSFQAGFMLLAIGLVARTLTYLSLLLKDRERRR